MKDGMSKNPILPVSYFSDRIDYNSHTGLFRWKTRTPDMFRSTGSRAAEHNCAIWNARYAGEQAFTSVDHDGYHTSTVGNRTFKAHQVAWALHYGCWPDGGLDHANRIRTDNRIANLRPATKVQNARNTTSRRGSTSAFVGVSKHNRLDKWVARIKEGDADKYLGLFGTEVEAAKARDAAAKRIYGEFASLNFSEVAC